MVIEKLTFMVTPDERAQWNDSMGEWLRDPTMRDCRVIRER